MNKEILLYGRIYDWSVEEVIAKLEEVKDSDVTLRINTPGGSVYANYGLIAKFLEHPKKKVIKVDGMAASSGAFLCLYADKVEALDVSRFLYHRAAYPSWLENDPREFTEAMRESLTVTNANLRAAMEGKFTAEKWEQVTGVSLDDLFSLDTRIDVELTAAQAKQLGIVTDIVKITPEKKAEIQAYVAQAQAVIAASMQFAPQNTTQNIGAENTGAQLNLSNNNSKSNKKMTLDQLKAEHPEVFAQAVQAGVSQERDRVNAFLVFADIDMKAVKEGIVSGSALTSAQMAEFSLKAVTAAKVTAMESASADPVTPEVPNDPATPTATKGKDAAQEAAINSLAARLGVKPEDLK